MDSRGLVLCFSALQKVFDVLAQHIHFNVDFGPAKGKEQFLLIALRYRVHRSRFQGMILRGRNWSEILSTCRARGFPPAGLEGDLGTNTVAWDLASGADVRAFAVNRHGRGDYEPPNTRSPLSYLFKQDRGTQTVCPDVAYDFVHRLTDAHQSGKVHDRGRTLQATSYVLRIRDIAAQEMATLRRKALLTRVYLRLEIVQYADLDTSLQ